MGLPVAENVRAEVGRLRKSWRRSYFVWSGLHLGLSLFGVLLSITAATKPPFVRSLIGAGGVEVLGWAATVFFAAFAVLTPSRNARAFIAAWRILNDQYLRSECLDEDDVCVALVDAIRRGEEIISGRDPF